MKIGYFFIVCFFVMPLSLKSNIVDDLKNWWKSLTEEKRKAVYDVGREHVSNVFTPAYAQKQLKEMFPDEYIKKDIVEPNVNHAYDIFSERLAKDTEKISSKIKAGAAVTVGAAVVGAATYGLYRWLTRRGLGGITNDAQAMNNNFNALLSQIDKKKIALNNKKPLTNEDKQMVNGLSMFIQSTVKDFEKNLKKLMARKGELEQILIKPSKENKAQIPVAPRAVQAPTNENSSGR